MENSTPNCLKMGINSEFEEATDCSYHSFVSLQISDILSTLLVLVLVSK